MSSLSKTAILLIDPYNDFLHPSGKANASLSHSLHQTHTISNLQTLLSAARENRIPIFYCLHHQMTPAHQLQTWTKKNRSLNALWEKNIFEEGSWGAEIYEGLQPKEEENGDVVVGRHWGSSSFENTDLDFQLRQRGVEQVVLAGLVANTCLESTARYAYERAYRLTMLSDCTAGFTQEAKEVAVNLVWPLFADQVLTVDEWKQSLV